MKRIVLTMSFLLILIVVLGTSAQNTMPVMKGIDGKSITKKAKEFGLSEAYRDEDFGYNDDLETVEIGGKNITIDEYAFYNCDTSFKDPFTTTGAVLKIAGNAFSSIGNPYGIVYPDDISFVNEQNNIDLSETVSSVADITAFVQTVVDDAVSEAENAVANAVADADAAVSTAVAEAEKATGHSFYNDEENERDHHKLVMKDYVGRKLSDIGYTSLGGDRFDRYSPALLQINFITEDGSYIDIHDDEVLSQYVVASQNIRPGTGFYYVLEKDSNGKDYSNLIDYQSISQIDLVVKKASLFTLLGQTNAIYQSVPVNQPADRYTWYIRNYVGKNLASIGYTSLGGDRFDKYGGGLIELIPMSVDGHFIDIEDDEILQNYVVIGQSVEPNTEFHIVFQKDNSGKDYSNLTEYQTIRTVILLVRKVGDTNKYILSNKKFTKINPAADKYTWFIKDYTGLNLASVGYTSLGGDRLDTYGGSHIEFVIGADDNEWIDIEDKEMLQQYVVIEQDVAPNTEFKISYQVDSEGKEYSNLTDYMTIDKIRLRVKNIDDLTEDDFNSHILTAGKPADDKYTRYIRDYVSLNLASFGYKSWGGYRMDEYGGSALYLHFITDDGSIIDIDDEFQMSQYIVTSQNPEPNTPLKLVFSKDSSGKEYSNSVSSKSFENIYLYVTRKSIESSSAIRKTQTAGFTQTKEVTDTPSAAISHTPSPTKTTAPTNTPVPTNTHEPTATPDLLATAQSAANQQLFDRAAELVELGKCDSALLILDAIPGHDGAEDLKTECKYQQAEALEANGEYIDAMLAFNELGDYKDSADRFNYLTLNLKELLAGDSLSREDPTQEPVSTTEPNPRREKRHPMTSPTEVPAEVPAMRGEDEKINKISVDSTVNIYIETDDDLRAGYDWEADEVYDEIPGVEISRSISRTSVELPKDLKYYLWMNFPESDESKTFDAVITSPGVFLKLTDIRESVISPNLIYSPPVNFKNMDMELETYEVVANGGELPGVDFTIANEYGEYNIIFHTVLKNGTPKALEAPVDFLILHNYDEAEISIWISALYDEDADLFRNCTFDVTAEFTLWDGDGERHVTIPATYPLSLKENGLFSFDYADWQMGEGLNIVADLDGDNKKETIRTLSGESSSIETPTEIPEPTAAPTQTPQITMADPDEVFSVKEFGWTLKSNGYIYYAVILHNNRSDVAVNLPSYRITARDKDGNLLGTERQVLNEIYPGQDTCFAGMAFSVSGQPATVEIEPITPDSYNLIAPIKMKHDTYIPLEVRNISKKTDFLGEKYLGEVYSSNAYDFSMVQVCILFRNENNALIGGECTYVNDLKANKSVPFETLGVGINAVYVEGYAQPW